MKWGKIVLIFQAVVTLILGFVFASQMVNVPHVQSPAIENLSGAGIDTTFSGLQDVAYKFKTTAWILLTISIIEIVIISRL
jgi:hypothetical protein